MIHQHIALSVYRAMTLPELYKEASHLLRKISNNPTHHDTRTLYELCHSVVLQKETAPLKRKTISLCHN